MNAGGDLGERCVRQVGVLATCDCPARPSGRPLMINSVSRRGHRQILLATFFRPETAFPQVISPFQAKRRRNFGLSHPYRGSAPTHNWSRCSLTGLDAVSSGRLSRAPCRHGRAAPRRSRRCLSRTGCRGHSGLGSASCMMTSRTDYASASKQARRSARRLDVHNGSCVCRGGPEDRRSGMTQVARFHFPANSTTASKLATIWTDSGPRRGRHKLATDWKSNEQHTSVEVCRKG